MFKSLVYSLITKGTVALINFFILVISSRYLGVSSRGEISVFILNITVIQIINEVYTGYSIVHFIPKFNFKKVLMYGICSTFVFCSLSNLVIGFLEKQVQGYAWIGYLVSLLVILNTFNCVLILARQNIRTYNFLSFIQPLLLLLGIVVYTFILHKDTFEAFVYPLLFSFILAFVISTFVVSGFFKKNSPVQFSFKSILTSGLVFQAATLMFIFVNRWSYYLLPDIAGIGLYASASSVMEALLIIVNAISPVLLARIANEGDTLKSADLALVLAKASLIFSLFGVVIIYLLPESFFIFVLGEGFSGIRQLMLLYAPGILMVSLFSPISYYFTAIGRQKIVLLCYCTGFFSTLLLAPIFIAKYNTAGAALNANIAYLLIAVAICSCFVGTSKLSFSRFFSFGTDYRNLKKMFSSKTPGT